MDSANMSPTSLTTKKMLGLRKCSIVVLFNGRSSFQGVQVTAIAEAFLGRQSVGPQIAQDSLMVEAVARSLQRHLSELDQGDGAYPLEGCVAGYSPATHEFDLWTFEVPSAFGPCRGNLVNGCFSRPALHIVDSILQVFGLSSTQIDAAEKKWDQEGRSQVAFLDDYCPTSDVTYDVLRRRLASQIRQLSVISPAKLREAGVGGLWRVTLVQPLRGNEIQPLVWQPIPRPQ